MEQDIKNINVPNLIRNHQYFQITSLVKNYEDTLQSIFAKSSKDSSITNDQFVFLWKIDEQYSDLFGKKPLFFDINIFLQNVLKDDVHIESILSKIVVTGPFIRSHFMGNSDDNIRKDIYLYIIDNDLTWDNVLNENVIDKKSEYLYEEDDKKAYFVKKSYKSPAHVILQHNYMKRIGWYLNNYYTSSMFLIEMQKHANLMMSNFKDPILGIPYDPMDIFQLTKQNINHPVKIIEMVDYDELTKLSKKNLIKMYNSKSCIEICLDKYVKEENPIILNQIKQMIIFLTTLSYKRPPFIYAKMLHLDKIDIELYNLLKCITNDYNIIDINETPNSLEDINNIIIEYIISKHNKIWFVDYIQTMKIKIGKTIIDYVIKYKSKIIATFLLENSVPDDNEPEIMQNKYQFGILFDKYLTYYMILMMEDLELIDLLSEELDVEFAVNFLQEICENGKIRSFYFLYENDNTIMNTTFDDEIVKGQTLLHKCTDINLTELILKIKPELINVCNSNKQNAVMYHSIHNPYLLKTYLEFDFDPTITDNDGNIFLHHLCKYKNNLNNYEPVFNLTDILKNILKKHPEVINFPNKKSETPAMTCCLHANENMFYTIKSMGCNLKAKDYFGNTVYHYICANSICIGMMIHNIENYFGMTPKDYCKISSKYYSFYDDEI